MMMTRMITMEDDDEMGKTNAKTEKNDEEGKRDVRKMGIEVPSDTCTPLLWWGARLRYSLGASGHDLEEINGGMSLDRSIARSIEVEFLRTEEVCSHPQAHGHCSGEGSDGFGGGRARNAERCVNDVRAARRARRRGGARAERVRDRRRARRRTCLVRAHRHRQLRRRHRHHG